ncbi:2-hydroxyacid dehydrogenase [Ferrimonas sp. SCSIO 43195]|uniref:2-hydroxyacid dehydrogenase n=1 Tax=Ferrimonas sp. SCSIO 43195 TaxID=2822844 RepID=UPI002075752B|nr:2-hydroxyacid dehydrogenase [Ferrimonas sp. SCSIO 43195]USD35667.1 2-hydroxyacid dehydrogenase [Ferrimonas sp. SCSIO 43195]
MTKARIAVFSSKSYDKDSMNAANSNYGFELDFYKTQLTANTAKLVEGYDAISCFVNDMVDVDVLSQLDKANIKMIALRCAGFNNIDLEEAKRRGFVVSRVPGYSPESVAEHAVAMLLCLNRKLHKAYSRIREHNFNLEGLLGFNLSSKTVGIIGTGKIGQATIRALSGFGCKILCHDPYPTDVVTELGATYVDLDTLYEESDVISLHCPLTPESNHMINRDAFAKMKPGVMLINTSRGALVNASDAIEALKSGKLGYLGLDVYELEGDLFFRDLSGQVIHDDVFGLLLSYPNVLVTGHQGYFTDLALDQIAETTLGNIKAYMKGETTGNEVF